MAEFIIVGSSGAFQLESQPNYSRRVTHEGGQTVYYSVSTRVSSTINDGTLTTGQTFDFTGRRFFITQSGTGTQGSSASLRLDNVPFAGETVANALPWTDPYDYGYDPIAADNSGAFNSAIAALPSLTSAPMGGKVIIPRGQSKIASSLVAHDTVGVSLEGQGGASSGQNNRAASQILYTGTGTGRIVDFRSAVRPRIAHCGVSYTNGFTGDIVDLSHSAGNDSTQSVVDDCLLYPEGANFQTANSCVLLENAIVAKIKDSKLGGTQWAVRGRDKAAAGYSNVVTIENTNFDNCHSGFIANAGQAWKVRDCTFEMLNTLFSVQSPAGTPYVYKSDYNGGASGGGTIEFEGCWVGDLGDAATAVVYISVDDSMAYFAWDGGYVSWGSTPAFQLIGPVSGGHIRGDISGTGAQVDLGSIAGGAGVVSGFTISDSTIATNQNGVSAVKNRLGHSVKVDNVIARNSSEDELSVPRGQHTYFQDGVTSPTLSVLGGGSGSFNGGAAGNDAASHIQITAPGGGYSAGDAICDITWGRDWANDKPATARNSTVDVIVFPSNSVSAAAILYHDRQYGEDSDATYRTAKSRIKTVNAIAGNASVRFGFRTHA